MKTAFGILAVLFLTAFQAGGTPPAVDTSVLFGTITDQHFVPIPGATVRVRNNLTQVSTVTRTNELGEYQVKSLRQGRYSLRAEAKDHEQVWFCEIVVGAGERVRQDIVLKSSLPGKVLPEPVCPERMAQRRATVKE